MNNIIFIINSNPFYLGWNKGWIFLLFLEGANAKIEDARIEYQYLITSGWQVTEPKG